jgi:hypothetical protein
VPRAATSGPLPRPPEARLPERETPPLPRAHTDHSPTSRPGDAVTSKPHEISLAVGDALTALPGEGITERPPSGPVPTTPRSMAIPRVAGAEHGRSQPTPTIPLPPGQTYPSNQTPANPANKVSSSSSMKPASGTEPPPPLQTDRKPINASPPPVITDNSDHNALEELLDAGKFDEALAGYKVMAKKQPSDRNFRAGIELCEGLRSLAARDRLEAAQRFEAALEIDPSNERAARELADMRRQATNERKGLLTRLMGKKES